MERVDISLLGRDYSFACQPAEREQLLAASKLVAQRMQTVSQGKNLSHEKAAVMTAIQVALELLEMRAPNGAFASMTVGDVKRRIDAMHDLLDQAVGQDMK